MIEPKADNTYDIGDRNTKGARLWIQIVWCGNDMVVVFDMIEHVHGKQIPRLQGHADEAIPKIGEWLKARLAEVDYEPGE